MGVSCFKWQICPKRIRNLWKYIQGGFLKEPRAYPQHVSVSEIHQTHIPWVSLWSYDSLEMKKTFFDIFFFFFDDFVMICTPWKSEYVLKNNQKWLKSSKISQNLQNYMSDTVYDVLTYCMVIKMFLMLSYVELTVFK
jgi:hypothetical protein